MNINEAKEQIKKAVTIYLDKDESGQYIIPLSQQRPLFVLGAPGIGKTEIMKQIAQELSIGLVSYSMTHHTRQSSLGLPFITDKEFRGEKYSVTEYTMSEILSTIYDIIETTNTNEGILFLDEINCVSETLAPSMLQFLQFKTFGQHKVPDGWVIVTAGNPPEYNKSVREYDVATWDRLKRLDVVADFNVWLAYAKEKGVHPSIISYLEYTEKDFFKIENTINGKTFTTARGWVDLSTMIKMFEKNNFTVDKVLVSQYLQNHDIAQNFSIYYDIFYKYRADYKVKDILSGENDREVLKRAKEASFDEQLALISMIMNLLHEDIQNFELEKNITAVFLKKLAGLNINSNINDIVESKKKCGEELLKGQRSGAMADKDIKLINRVIICFDEIIEKFRNEGFLDMDVFKKTYYKKRNAEQEKQIKIISEEITNVIKFMHSATGDSQPFILMLTQLTENKFTLNFISSYNVQEYYKFNDALLIDVSRGNMLTEIAKIE